MNDIVVMEVLYCENNLSQVELGNVLFEVNFFFEHFTEVSTWHVLHDEKKSVVGTECKRRFDEIVASNVLESLIFVFDQSHLILSPAFFDFDNFDGVKVVGVFPLCQVDFTKGSFS